MDSPDEMELPALGAVSRQVALYASVSVTIICMSPWLKKLVLAAALLVMPLQGVAATLSVLLCHGDANTHVAHSPSNADHGLHQGGVQDEGGTSSQVAYHPCCNHIVSSPPVATSLAARFDFYVPAFAPDTRYDLFVPGPPQRPPLA